MADIRTIGIRFDASQAVAGADKAKKASREMGDSMQRDLQKVDQGAKKTGSTVKAEGQKMEGSSKEVRNEVQKLGSATGFQRMAQNARSATRDIRGGFFDLMDSMGLFNGRIGRMIQQSTRAYGSFTKLAAGAQIYTAKNKNAGDSTARTVGNLTEIGVAASRAGSGLKIAGASAGALGTAAAFALPIIAALAAALVAIGAGVGVFKLLQAGIPKAAAFEDAKVGMAVLLGGFDQATEKLNELNKFANKTPFETAGLIEGSRLLEVFTKGLLNNEEGWKLVGDAAAAAQEPFEGVALWVGRLYDGLQSGRPVGEATSRLQEMGLISGDVRGRIEDLQKSGAEMSEIWPVLEQALGKFTGTMELQSQTWNGLMSTLRDEWSTLLRGFAAPVIEGLKPALEQAIVLVQQLAPLAQDFGQALGDGITFLIETLSSGQIGQALGLGLIAAIEQSRSMFTFLFLAAIKIVISAFVSLLTAAITAPIQLFASSMTTTIDLVTKLLTGNFSGAMGTVVGIFGDLGISAVQAIGISVYNDLGQAFEDIVNAFSSGMFSVINSLGSALNAFSDKYAFGLGKISPIGSEAARTGNLDVFKPIAGGGFGDLNKAADSFSGTFGRDLFGEHVARVVERAKSKRPELVIPESPDLGLDSLIGGTEQNDALIGGTGGADSGIKALKTQRKAIEDNRSELQKTADKWADLGTQIDQVSVSSVESIAGNMTQSISGLIDGTTSAKEAFSNMANSIISDILRMIVQMQIQAALASVLGGRGGEQGVASSLVGAVAHTGGTVGKTGFSQTAVPKFHSGGMSSNEQMIKVEKGENILTRKRSKEIENELAEARGDRSRGKGQNGNQVTIMNITDRSEVADAVVNRPDAVVNAISRKLPQIRKLVLGS